MKEEYILPIQDSLKGVSLIDISKKYKISYHVLYRFFIKNNIKINKADKRRCFVNDSFLDKIDSEDKCYLLGLLFSDGYINKNRICLKLKKNDSYLIKDIFSKFTNGYNLSEDKNSTSIAITSNKLVEKLNELGCKTQKTHFNFKLMSLNNELFRHYLRGYFDGDGSISLRKNRPNQIQVYICSIHKEFLESLKNRLKDYKINSLIFKENREGKPLKTPEGKILMNCKDMYTLRLGTHVDKLKLYELLYKNCNIKLERKYKIFSEYYANTVLILESKNSKTVQRIENETLINYSLITENTFRRGKEVNENLIISLFNEGFCEYKIHKNTKIGRKVIERIIKEYKSPRVPDNL